MRREKEIINRIIELIVESSNFNKIAKKEKNQRRWEGRKKSELLTLKWKCFGPRWPSHKVRFESSSLLSSLSKLVLFRDKSLSSSKLFRNGDSIERRKRWTQSKCRSNCESLMVIDKRCHSLSAISGIWNVSE